MHPPVVLSPKLEEIRTKINMLSSQERQTFLQTVLADVLPMSDTAEGIIIPITPTPVEPALLNHAPRAVFPVEPRSLESAGLPVGKPFTKLEDYVADWWPEEETADDINDFVRQMRQEDLALELD